MLKLFRTIRTHWKKSTAFAAFSAYASTYFIKWHKEDLIMRDYAMKAREFGRRTITASERPRKIIVFLNPAAKSGKTKYLLDKHILPLLHLAGIEIHVVRTEHEGQAKDYMSVLDNNIVDAIVVAGGDGTLSEIVTGLLRRGDQLALKIPIGVLPFGNTNSFASLVFPPQELEVERFCRATMAVIENRVSTADVMRVTPEATEKSKDVYLLTSLKWGIHSDIHRQKDKHWYFPGPLKLWYCYWKKILSADWPPLVSAEVEITPPCNGCCRCLTAPPEPTPPPKPSSSWWWSQSKVKPRVAPTPDPRLKVENEVCGEVEKRSISAPEISILGAQSLRLSDSECSSLELKVMPTPTKYTELIGQSAPSSQAASQSECTSAARITIKPTSTEPWFVMDSERFEAMPCTVTLLRDQIKIFRTAS